MNVQDFRAVIGTVSALLPAALLEALTQRAELLTDGQRKAVADILLEALRVHGEMLSEGVSELKTILRKAKAGKLQAAEAADTSALPEF